MTRAKDIAQRILSESNVTSVTNHQKYDVHYHDPDGNERRHTVRAKNNQHAKEIFRDGHPLARNGTYKVFKVEAVHESTIINELGGDGTTSGTPGPSALLHHQIDKHMREHGHTPASDGGWSGSSGPVFHHKGEMHSPGTHKARTRGVGSFHRGLDKLGFHSHEKSGSGGYQHHTWQHDSGHTLTSFSDGGEHHRYTHLDHNKNGRVDPSRVTHHDSHVEEMEKLESHHFARERHHGEAKSGDSNARHVAGHLHNQAASYFGNSMRWHKRGEKDSGERLKKIGHMYAKLAEHHEKEHGLD